jgi:hypothetical protein
MIVGAVFALVGLKTLLLGRTKTHRFDLRRGLITIDSKGLGGSDQRELPLNSIAYVVLEEIHGRGAPSHYIHYVTARCERIAWSTTYDGSKENTQQCFQAAREFMGIATVQTPQPRAHMNRSMSGSNRCPNWKGDSR